MVKETGNVDLIEELEQKLAETERIAREACDGDSGAWFVGRKDNIYRVEEEDPRGEEEHRLVAWGNVAVQSEHVALNDPKRVLVKVAADREILAEHRDDGYGACLGCGLGADEEYRTPDINDCRTLLALAKGYGIDTSGSATG